LGDLSNEILGVGSHSDSGIITLLLQDEVSGLQVLNHEQKWVDVKPISDAFVVNIGDMLQIWSNDQFQATQHRVVVNSNKDRYSIPFFFNPHFTSEIKPLDVCVDKDHPLRYKPCIYGQYMNERHAGNQADYGEEIQISHYRIN